MPKLENNYEKVLSDEFSMFEIVPKVWNSVEYFDEIDGDFESRVLRLFHVHQQRHWMVCDPESDDWSRLEFLIEKERE